MKPQVLWSLALLLSLLSAPLAFSQNPAVSLSTKNLSFGPQMVGMIGGAQIVTLNNAAGAAPLAISSIAPTGDFAASAPATTCVVGTPVVAGAHCDIAVTFTPTATGARSGSLTITDNDKGVAGSAQVVSLTGTGVPPGICSTGVVAFCIDQPVDGATKVTGKGGVAGGSVSLIVNTKSMGGSVNVIADGSFSITVNPALKQYDVVEVDGAAAGAAPAAKIGPLSVTASPPAAPVAAPCLTVTPAWVTIPSKKDTLTPIKISSCDTPPADLSKDKVTLLPANPAVTFPPPPADTCKSAATSELDCNLTVTPKADRQLYYVEVDDKNGKLVGDVALHIGDPNRYWVGMAGLDVTSTSGGPEQQWFARASIMDRLFDYDKKHAHGGLWAWVDAKIGSIPTAKTSALSSLTSVSAAVSGSGVQNAGDISQSLEFHVGLAPSLYNKTASLLVGFGAASPINSITGAQEYSLNQNLYNQFVSNAPTTSSSPSALSLEGIYPQLWTTLQCSYASPKPTGCPSTNATTVAFVLPNRSRFYRDYFGGIRFWFDPRGTGNSFPGIFDVTVGQDEVVTGGHLRGVVLTLMGDYPITSAVRVFGSVHMRIAKNINTIPLDMLPTTSFVDPTTSAVVVQQTTPLDQDYFRVGVGLDISQVWKQIVAAATTAAAAKKPATPQ